MHIYSHMSTVKSDVTCLLIPPVNHVRLHKYLWFDRILVLLSLDVTIGDNPLSELMLTKFTGPTAIIFDENQLRTQCVHEHWCYASHAEIGNDVFHILTTVLLRERDNAQTLSEILQLTRMAL